MELAGYLVNRTEGPQETRGLAYDYIMASNGLFVAGVKVSAAGEPLIRARVGIAAAEVRGLQPLREELALPQGKVPAALLAAAEFMAVHRLPAEVYVAISWRGGGYHLLVPEQETTGGSVRYTAVPDTVVDIHSHAAMPAFFSGADDADDSGFRVSVVFGRMHMLIHDMEARVSVYGYHGKVYVGDVFG